MKQNTQRTARYNGITFIDVDNELDLPTDYETDRIPNKGDVMYFKHIIGNNINDYHWEVLYIYDQRTLLSNPVLEECKHFGISIYVVMKRIHPELGDNTWRSVNAIINK